MGGQVSRSRSGTLAEPVDEEGLGAFKLTDLLGRSIGNYVLERPLAEGGMSVVFLAKHPALGREVAVKFLNSEFQGDLEMGQRFLQEAKVTATLVHPNIVEILDFGELEGHPYYVMELLTGCDLADHLKQQRRFSFEEVATFVEQICAALQTAHEVGIVHRDLKPANVFVVDHDPPLIKLMDFGIARVEDSQRPGAHTRHGQILGTPSHMAPEQALGKVEQISARTDLYSLGVIAYEMLTGHLPFEADSDVMLMAMHIRDSVPAIADVCQGVPTRFAQIIEQCLEKDPGRRPATAKELAARLNTASRLATLQQLPEHSAARSASSTATLPPATPPALPQTRDLQSSDDAVEPVLDRSHAKADPSGETGRDYVSRRIQDPAGKSPAPEASQPEEGLMVSKRVTQHPKGAGGLVIPPTVDSKQQGTVGDRAASTLGLVGSQGKQPTITSALQPLTPHVRSVDDPEGIALPGVSAPEQEALDPVDGPRSTDPAEPSLAETVARRASIEAPPPLLSEITDEPSEPGGVVQLSAADGEVLQRLIRRMEKKGDFPSFLSNMSEITEKADADKPYSASQLGESILKDFALTAKLLRIVNTRYVNRFGGKVFSVNQAVVILGFDSVRTLALGVSVYKTPTATSGANNKRRKASQAFTAQVAESAINSLVSGEIARLLAPKAKLDKQAELAMMSAMFRNVGLHLVMEYLPEDYARMVDLVISRGLSIPKAAEKALGASPQKLALGIAEHWKLPESMRIAMSTTPSPKTGLHRTEERLSAVARLATDLCHIITTSQDGTRQRALDRLVEKNREVLTLAEGELAELIDVVSKSFEEKYSALFGPQSRQCRFLMNARNMTGRSPGSATGKPEDTVPPAEADGLNELVQSLTERLKQRMDPQELMKEALEALGRLWRVPRALLLGASSDHRQIRVKAGFGPDVEILSQKLSFPFTRNADVFSTALKSGKTTIVEDSLGKSGSGTIPQPYFELVGSPSFAAVPCVSRGYPTVVLLADGDFPEKLPSAAHLESSLPLRELLARIAAA